MDKAIYMDRNQQMPVIVLLDKDTADERTEIKEWFENSRFSTCEASNVFDALEQLSDFTLRTRPDIVLVDVDCCEDDLPVVRHMADLPVMALSGKSHSKNLKQPGNYYYTNMQQVASRLDKLIPQ